MQQFLLQPYFLQEIKVDKICLAGTVAYDRLKSLLTSTLLLGDIKKLSSDAQTSCLEGFHATLNHWHPKMIGFSWFGTFCRYFKFSLDHDAILENVYKAVLQANNIDATLPLFSWLHSL